MDEDVKGKENVKQDQDRKGPEEQEKGRYSTKKRKKVNEAQNKESKNKENISS